MANDLPNANDFPTLFSPIKLGSLEVKNRIGVPAPPPAELTRTVSSARNASTLTQLGPRAEPASSPLNARSLPTGAPRPPVSATRASADAHTMRACQTWLKECNNVEPGLSSKLPPASAARVQARLQVKFQALLLRFPLRGPQDFEQRIMPRGYETKAATLGATTPPKVLTLEEIHYMERTFPDAVQGC